MLSSICLDLVLAQEKTLFMLFVWETYDGKPLSFCFFILKKTSANVKTISIRIRYL